MFKRMSVLVRRPGDDRDYFSRRWEAHAAPVSGLPRLRGYIQNHVEEDFAGPLAAPLLADGFVEQLWDREEDMTAAFAGPAAQPMIQDEASFLGHGSGYALTGAAPLRAASGGKLILAVVTGENRIGLDTIENEARALPGLLAILRDDVADLIAKPGMAPPQPVDSFLHLYFADAGAASAAAGLLTKWTPPEGVRLRAFGVRTKTFV
jgi:hypothetical protein